MTKPVKPEDRKKTGRPSKFEEISKRMPEIEKLLMHGLTDKELADFLGICEATLTNYKKEHTEFLASLKEGKLKADLEVEKSLFKRATGFEFEEVQTEAEPGKGEKATPVIKYVRKTKKYYPPDTAAAFIWLKNRRGEKWVDKSEVKIDPGEEMKELAKKLSGFPQKALEKIAFGNDDGQGITE